MPLLCDSLEVKEVAEHVIQGLQGHYVELASDTLGFGFKLVRACLATPCGKCLVVLKKCQFCMESFALIKIFGRTWEKEWKF